MRNRFFFFSSVSVRFFEEKNSDSVRNEFGSVRFKTMRFGLDIKVIYYYYYANITATVDDITDITQNNDK